MTISTLEIQKKQLKRYVLTSLHTKKYYPRLNGLGDMVIVVYKSLNREKMEYYIYRSEA